MPLSVALFFQIFDKRKSAPWVYHFRWSSILSHGTVQQWPVCWNPQDEDATVCPAEGKSDSHRSQESCSRPHDTHRHIATIHPMVEPVQAEAVERMMVHPNTRLDGSEADGWMEHNRNRWIRNDSIVRMRMSCFIRDQQTDKRGIGGQTGN